MSTTDTPATVIQTAVQMACRAPSYHNSQPWRWEYANGELRLYVDVDRLVATDGSGRQALISCGAALDHVVVALAGKGQHAQVDHYPNPNDNRHLASITTRAMSYVTQAHRRRARAIWVRHTDRLPLDAPPNWSSFERMMRASVAGHSAHVDVLTEVDRKDLEEASLLSESLRLYDSSYHHEIHWWTTVFEFTDGIPHDTLVSSTEADRVPVNRTFPVTHHQERRLEIPEDRSTVVVVSAKEDTRRDVLDCGETLSAILLEATLVGYATEPCHTLLRSRHSATSWPNSYIGLIHRFCAESDWHPHSTTPPSGRPDVRCRTCCTCRHVVERAVPRSLRSPPTMTTRCLVDKSSTPLRRSDGLRPRR